jgi:hypothetical protein
MVRWVPIFFFLLGGLIVVLGSTEYFRVRTQILQGREEKNSRLRDSLVVLTLVFLLAVSVIFIASMP